MGKLFRFKVLLLGPGEVGKTSLLYKYVKNQFSKDYMITIGAQFLSKDIEFKKDKATLQLWDLGGQKRFKFLHKQFYTASNGALLIFDLTRFTSFEEMEDWYLEMKEILKEEIPFVLIGNKIDLIKEIGRVFDENQAKDFAESKGSLYMETSAKTGENVEEAFKKLTILMAESKGEKIK